MRKSKTALTSENLKNQLWDNILAVKSKKMTPQEASAISTQSREIIRIVRTEMEMNKMNKGSSKQLLLG